MLMCRVYFFHPCVFFAVGIVCLLKELQLKAASGSGGDGAWALLWSQSE